MGGPVPIGSPVPLHFCDPVPLGSDSLALLHMRARDTFTKRSKMVEADARNGVELDGELVR